MRAPSQCLLSAAGYKVHFFGTAPGDAAGGAPAAGAMVTLYYLAWGIVRKDAC